MTPSEKCFGNLHRVLNLPAFLALVALPCFITSYAKADIYRFVTIDGIETFTDAPINRNAKVVLKEHSAKIGRKAKKLRTEKIHEVSLNEVVEKTVTASFQQQNSTTDYFEPRLPPVGGIITSGVGMRIDPIDGKWRQHNGIDIAVREGTPVAPAAPGIVVFSGLRPGYGYTVLVEHDYGLVTLYGHNSALLAIIGQRVDIGTPIALSGNTGRSTGPHLHFEAWQAGINVTPTFMPGNSLKPPKFKLASARVKSHFRKEILADGSLLFTNIPASIP
ncbi:MAG: M23 family metallopeptidase [Desulfuromonadaceae bacterium]|nr:M23 family metallopeptidase [Desulfuromonadaceae bacterium]